MAKKLLVKRTGYKVHSGFVLGRFAAAGISIDLLTPESQIAMNSYLEQLIDRRSFLAKNQCRHTLGHGCRRARWQLLAPKSRSKRSIPLLTH